ncbi:hypothetical protein DM558_06175 [Entomomonas moraniae]|uniref:Uncharacterized protein n=1 Tax=Entomomonas moraniae TaxID=2213226 RepID=A0A3Q9JIP6_9GAMM|nr:hypothetical protein [Entomomonas moraniae]AZS50386.1 hypothetical protein DM558_06175 [Entomomonas moraniae]
MANRSKKVVLSARVPSYLKAGIDITSTCLNKSTVSIIEEQLEDLIDTTSITFPVVLSSERFARRERLSIRKLMSYIWNDDEIIFKLRIGIIGDHIAGSILSRVADWACNDLFKGEYPLFGDLNGHLTQNPEEFDVIEKHIDLEKVRAEWDTLNAYMEFLEKNKPLNPSYEQYKKMLNNS